MIFRATLLVLLTVLALAFAACGDDNGDSTESVVSTDATTTVTEDDADAEDADDVDDSDEADADDLVPPEVEIGEAVTEFLVSSDSEDVCADLLAPEALTKTYGGLQGCLDGRPPQSLAREVAVKKVKVSGEKAKAFTVPKGGVYSGELVTFDLQSIGDDWLITGVSADIPVGP
jgi:hypothetical protein